MKRVIATLGALLLTLATAGAAGAYVIINYGDQSGNGVADSWTLDDNGDGSVDRLVMDGNEDGVIDITMGVDASGRSYALWIDSNVDYTYDAVLVPYYANGGTGAQVASLIYRDIDQNGLYEHQFYDGQLDGYYEWVAVDTNADGAADTWRANAAPAGHTATDELARQVASVGAVNILHAAGIPVFFPVSTIPLGG